MANRTTGEQPIVVSAYLLLGLSIGLELSLPSGHLVREYGNEALWLLAPIGALVAIVLAAQRTTGRLRSAWLSLGSAALLAIISSELWQTIQPDLFGPSGEQTTRAAQLIIPLALISGSVLATQRRDRRGPDLNASIDATIVMIGAFLLLERFYFPLIQSEVATSAQALGGLSTGFFSMAALFSAAFMVLRPSPRLPLPSPSLLMAGIALVLLGGILTIAMGGSEPLSSMPGGLRLDRLSGLAGWLTLGLAALIGARSQPGTRMVDSSPTPRFRLQRLLVPGMGLVLGGVMLEMGLRGQPVSMETGLIGGMLAILISCRLRIMLRVNQEHLETQRLMAQNKALVEMSRALADATDLNRVLDLVSRWACKLLGAHGAGVELLDNTAAELELRAIYGLPNHLLGLRTPTNGSLSGSVISSGQATAVSAPGDGVDHQARADSSREVGAFPTAIAPLCYRDQSLGVLFAIRFDRDFDSADLELLTALADQASLAIRNAQLFEEVRALSLTDPLTGLANRRQLNRDLHREFAAAGRGRRLIAVLFDLDNFKEYNDEYGHPAGDEVLRLFGQSLARETRSMNLAARYGGDEFISLLADTNVEGATIFVERVIGHFDKAIEELGQGDITVSAGMAEYDPSMQTPGDLVAAADKALYQVKPSRVSGEVRLTGYNVSSSP